MNRPYSDEKMNKRQLVWYWRKQAAWDLAHHKFDEVTKEEFDRAFRLLDRCLRYGLANHRFVESETEFNCNSPIRKHKGELLYRRLGRLNDELSRYDARLTGSMFPEVVCSGHGTDSTICRLYPFD